MSYTHYDRLTALDSTFLAIENDNVHMHVGAIGIFETGPLRREDGGLDIDRIFAVAEASMQRIPRFRQRLGDIPLFNHPVWVDDDRFNLHYHVRHTSLPHPGDLRLLKRLAGRIMSQKLDRGKPLWEMWFVEGLEGDRFAIVTKVHHCMIDGMSGVDLLAALMTADPQSGQRGERRWIPRPAPGPAQLFADELYRHARLPLSLLHTGQRALADPGRTLASVRDAVEGLGEAVTAGLFPATATPLNPEIGPHRRFDWTNIDLEAVREVKNRLGGTVNDVVLATVSGAVRRFLKRRGENVQDLTFRSMVPVNVRRDGQHGALGNRVSFLMAQLPIDERDPRRRLERVIETTRQLKDSKQAFGAETLEEISDSTLFSLFIEFARQAAQRLSYNMVVTNVPGPQFPVYLQGARMQAIYPLVPLFMNQALNIALFSYNGGLFWGFNSDWDAVPDLHDFVQAIEQEFTALRRLAADSPVEIVRTEAEKPRATRRSSTRRRTSAA